MRRPTEYTFTRADGTAAHHIVDPDCGTTVMAQIRMFAEMEGAVRAVRTRDLEKPRHTHTAGPWVIWDDGVTVGIEDGSGEPIAIAEVVDHGDLSDRAQLAADQALIASAPDMLSALKECVTAYEVHRDAQPTGHLWPYPNHIFAALRAIAKAETGA